MYVCQAGQFNFSLGIKLGYEYMRDFLPGWIDGSKDVTWQGKNASYQTIEEVMDSLFNYDYSDDYIEGYNIYPNVKDIPSSTNYIFPHGYCLLLDKTHSYNFLSVFTQKKLTGKFYEKSF